MKKLMFNNNSGKSIFEQIVDHIEAGILTGDLVVNTFIPSVRDFAVKNSVNPNTVAKAYQELQRKDLVTSVRGKGLQVNVLKDNFIEKRKKQILKVQIKELIQTSKSLGISEKEIIKMIEENL